MAKKQKSFAEKASSSPKGKELVHVKFVKSVPSERDGFWRFNESMISMEKGETLDATLKKMDDEANLADIEMPSLDTAVEDVPQEVNNEEMVESPVEPESEVDETTSEDTPAAETQDDAVAESKDEPEAEIIEEETAEEPESGVDETTSEDTPAAETQDDTVSEESVPDEEIQEVDTSNQSVEEVQEEVVDDEPSKETLKDESTEEKEE